MRQGLRRLWGNRGQTGFSTIAIAFVMLALSVPIVLIAESVLVAGRQAANTALGQENLRAVDSAMAFVVREVRLDPESHVGGCQEAGSTKTVTRNEPLRGVPSGEVSPTLTVSVQCAMSSVGQPADGRRLTFTATVNGKDLGRSRIRLIDKVGAATEPGAEILVCDWRLGVDPEPLTDC